MSQITRKTKSTQGKKQGVLTIDETRIQEPQASVQKPAQKVFSALDTSNSGVLTIPQIIKQLEIRGLRRDDTRLGLFFSSLERFEDGRITLDRFEACADSAGILIQRAFSGELVIPQFQEFTAECENIYNQFKNVNDGQVAKYIPQLAGVKPEKFGLSVCTIDGQRYSIGDSKEYFSIQSTSKPVTYCLALEEHGEEKVHQHVGREPSGVSFNALTLNNHRRPHNPMINSGAIMSCSLIRADMTPADRFDYVLDRWAKLCGGTRPTFNNSVYLSEKATADRNFALAYFMRENGAFPEGVKINDVLEFYFQCCSMELTTDQFAIAAASLANGGVCPMTGERVFSNQSVKNCLSLMASCGMYDYSGEFAFTVGLPAKSGVGGGLIVVIPNVMGICIWSPPLDKLGNPVRGLGVCSKLIERFNFHNFDSLVQEQNNKIDPRLHKNQSRLDGVMSLCWAASQGDLAEVQQLITRGVDVNEGDYDGRTALHLAASEGHLNIAKYLLQQGARVDLRDRWGGTPLDDARREGREAIISLFESVAQHGITAAQLM